MSNTSFSDGTHIQFVTLRQVEVLEVLTETCMGTLVKPH